MEGVRDQAKGLMEGLETPVWLSAGRPDPLEMAELGYWQDHQADLKRVEEVLQKLEQLLQAGKEEASFLESKLLSRFSNHPQEGFSEHSYSDYVGIRLGCCDCLDPACQDWSPLKGLYKTECAVRKLIISLATSPHSFGPRLAHEIVLRIAAQNPGFLLKNNLLYKLPIGDGHQKGASIKLLAAAEYANANLLNENRSFSHKFSSRESRLHLLERNYRRDLRQAIAQTLHQCRSVLISHNLREAVGDEWIRNSYLLAALLHSNPRCRITVLSGKPFLYNNPRITVINPRDLFKVEALLSSHSFDIIFDQYYLIDHLNQGLAPFIQQLKEEAKLVFRTPKGSNYFSSEYSSVHLKGWSRIELRHYIESLANPYDFALRLVSWCKLSCPAPLEIGKMLLTGREDKAFESWWKHHSVNHLHRKTVMFSPFGGTYEIKGFKAEEEALVVSIIERLVEDNYLVFLPPNGTPWGSSHHVEALKSKVDPRYRDFVVCHIPTPQTHETFQVHLMSVVDKYIGVEGGGAHLALASCADATILLLPVSGFHNWLPLRRVKGQRDVWLSNWLKRKKW